MKKVLIVLILIIAVIGIYWKFFKHKNEPVANIQKEIPIKVNKHSALFNSVVDSAIAEYLNVKNAFVESDTIKVKESARKFIQVLDRIPLEELKKDTATIVETVMSNLADVKSNTESLINQKDITEMKQDFRAVSEMLYPSFFKAINYEGPKLYWQTCPMAFGEDKPASWLSNTEEIINPYLGKNHPQYKATMLHCGETQDSVMAQ